MAHFSPLLKPAVPGSSKPPITEGGALTAPTTMAFQHWSCWRSQLRGQEGVVPTQEIDQRRDVLICFDSDITNTDVQEAMFRLRSWFAGVAQRPRIALCELMAENGVDDFLARHGPMRSVG